VVWSPLIVQYQGDCHVGLYLPPGNTLQPLLSQRRALLAAA
jgi:hypothetical protein